MFKLIYPANGALFRFQPVRQVKKRNILSLSKPLPLDLHIYWCFAHNTDQRDIS